jgi:hypothetical protein
VILVDTNLLVYASLTSFPQHPAARAWLEERLAGPAPVGLPWPSLLGYLRIVTNPRIVERPAPVARAWTQVTEWLSQDVVWSPLPAERHAETLAPLLGHVGQRANLIPDAHLAALAIEHGLTLHSTDADFARFPGLRWENPLA